MLRPLIFACGALRSFTTALVAVLLGLYLAALGFAPETLGLVVGAGLVGNAIATAVVATTGDQLGRRRCLVAASLLSAVGTALFAFDAAAARLAVFAGLGMMNGMGRDRGAAQTIDQALLADASPAGPPRTALFARYTLVQDIAGMLGSLAAGAPALLHRAGFSESTAYRSVLLAVAAVGLIQAALYARLPGAIHTAPHAGHAFSIQPETKRRVAGLSALFALDSLGGGFLASSILSYWFFKRFGLGPESIAGVFSVARLLNALSYFTAEALARRIGLVQTMVFTHLPSSLALLVLPFVWQPWLAIALYLFREGLVQMDVPTRQSYVSAVVAPTERTFALGVTGLTRNVGWALGPAASGIAMAALGLGAPLVIGGGLKIVYDVLLFVSYRRVRLSES